MSACPDPTSSQGRTQTGALAKAKRHMLVGPPFLWKMKRKFQIDFLVGQGLRPHHRLLDIGCGTLRGGIAFIDYLEPGRYTGVDVRSIAIDEGKRELREAGLEHKRPHLVLATDLASLDLPDKFELVWAFSVIIHMSDDTLPQCLAFASRHLAEGGRFYANVICTRKIQVPSWLKWREFPVVARSREFYAEQSAKVGLSIRDLGSLWSLGHRTGFPGQDLQRMYLFERTTRT